MKKLIVIFIVVVSICSILLYLKNEYGYLLLQNSTYSFSPLIKGNSKADNLFLGSSVFRQGLDIYTLESAFPKSNWILSYNGNQPVFEYEELLFLDRFHFLPQRVFIDMYAFSAVLPSKINDDRIFLHTDIAFKWKLWENLRINSENALSLWWQIFVTSNNENLVTWFLHKPLIEKRYYRGGNILEVGGMDSLSVEMVDLNIPQEKLQENQRIAIKNMVQFCQRKGVEIAFIETPKYKTLIDEPYINIMRDFISTLDSLNVKYYLTEETGKKIPELKNLSQGNFISFDSSLLENFHDPIHLSSKGRRTFTKALLNHL